jgi:tetratricopeptide (TPR) repeat protein
VWGFAAAQADLEAVSEAKHSLRQCRDYLENDDIDAAIEWAKKAVALAPNDPECHLWLGHAFGEKAQEASIFKKKGYAKKCREAYETAVGLEPENLEYRMALLEFLIQAPGSVGGGKDQAVAQAGEIASISPAAGHYALAAIHFHHEDFEEAKKEINKAIELDPGSTKYYHVLAAIYQNQKDFEKVAEVLEKILEIDPEDNLAAIGHCQILMNRGEFEQVKDVLLGVVARDSTQTTAYFMLAISCWESGTDVDDGIDYMETFFDLERSMSEKDRATGLVRLGGKCEEIGDTERAISVYEKVLDLDPGNKDAKKALREVESKN